MASDLRYLAGLQIPFQNVGEIYPLTLKEIAEIGEMNYHKYLNVLTFNIEDIKASDEEEGKVADFTPFEILLANIFFADEELRFEETVADALMLFFREKPTFDKRGFFYFGKLSEGRTIDQDNFDELRKVIMEQNCLLTEKEKEDIYNPANERARKIAEKLNKARKKIAELKKKQSEEGNSPSLTLFDLISILASNGNNLNISNIWELTMYQFNNQFNRMKMLDEYEINVQALLHGADSSKIELKHYMRKIES